MSAYPAPTNNNNIYNPSYFVTPTTDSIITTSYLEENYLPSTGIANSACSLTTFSGQIEVIDYTNGSSTGGSITTSGGIESTKDIYIGSGNITSNASSTNVFTNSDISLGSINGTITAGNVSCKNIISTGNITCSTGSVTSSSLTTGNITSTTGSLISSATTGNVFNSISSLNVGTSCNNISIGNISGPSNSSLNLNSKTVAIPNNLQLSSPLIYTVPLTVFNTGTFYLSGSIVCQMICTGSFKQVIITCLNATSNSSGAWTVNYPFPYAFQYTNQGMSYQRLTNLNSTADTNCSIVATNTSVNITIAQNTRSNNIIVIMGI